MRLSVLVYDTNAEGLLNFMGTLSASERRTAGFLLSEEILPKLEIDAFWTLFNEVVPVNSKAYLITFLKAFVRKYKEIGLAGSCNNLSQSALECFSTYATTIDKSKLLSTLLPVLRYPNEVELLMLTLRIDDVKHASKHLLAAATMPAFFQLFEMIKRNDPDSQVIRSVAIEAMKLGTPKAMRFTAILKQYFNLGELPGTFSNPIDHYRLGRLDSSYDNFKKEMNR